MGAHKLWGANPPLCASECVNGTVDHMTHQTRCQSKLLTKPFIPFFLKKVLNQSLIAKPSCNWKVGQNLYNCSIGTGTKGAWYVQEKKHIAE